MDSNSIALELPYKPPYDWDSMLAFLRKRAIAGIEIVQGDTYARTFDIDAAHGIVCVAPSTNDSLRAFIRTQKSSALPQVLAKLRRLFDLATDPQPIALHFKADAALAPLLAARPGLRVPGAWDGFELAIRAVLGQQISVTAAIALAGKLVTRYGAPLQCDNTGYAGLTHVFPQADRIATADIAALGMPRTRARALNALGAAIAADPHIFGARGSLEEAIAQLRSLSGVGEWTAQYIAMRELREPDAFPAADIGLMRAMADVSGKRPSARELLARAESWRPWRAYAAQHLWTSDGAEKRKEIRGNTGSTVQKTKRS